MGNSASKFQPIGPAYVCIGDPTQTGGAGMTLLEKVDTAGYSINPRTAFVSDDQRAGVPLADGLYSLASQPEAQVSLSEAGLDTIEALLYDSTRTQDTTGTKTDVIGFPDRFQAVAAADVKTMCIVPVSQAAAGSSAENGLWLPAVTVQTVDGFSLGRDPESVQRLLPKRLRQAGSGGHGDPAGQPRRVHGRPRDDRAHVEPADADVSWSVAPSFYA